MRRALRENALCAAAAGAGCAATAWLGLYSYAWNDYEVEVKPAYQALVHGHFTRFLQLAPAYGGSLLERAPFALLPGLWSGGELAVYRMVALPCLLAAAALGVWLVARMRAHSRSALARAVALAVVVANPVTVRALELGHPEELLGAVLCVAAVLTAAASSDAVRDRRPGAGRQGAGQPGSGRPGSWQALAAGVLLGLAVANKEWALVALGPVLAAVAPGRRLRCLIAAAATAGVVLAPLALVSSSSFTAGTRATASTSSAIFQPWQVWWFLGSHAGIVRGLFGTPKPGYRTGPAWTGAVSHPLIVLVGLALAALLWWRSRARALDREDALLALAAVLLARCLLDTWDTVYYLLPFLFALVAWESTRPSRNPPLLALAASALVWLSFQWLPQHASADAQAAFFLAWSLPLAGWLWARTLGGRGRLASADASPPRRGRAWSREHAVDVLIRGA